MTDELNPALTPEEWTEREVSIGNKYDAMHIAVRDGCFCVSEMDGSWTRERIEAVAALANAALPDDSPHKITRADVRALEVVYKACVRIPGVLGIELARAIEDMYRLAGKLAALLPPEGVTLKGSDPQEAVNLTEPADIAALVAAANLRMSTAARCFVDAIVDYSRQNDKLLTASRPEHILQSK